MVAGLQQQLTNKDAVLQAQENQLHAQQSQLHAQTSTLKQSERTILLLEELLRLKKIQQFAASSEKLVHQIHLFDEAEREVEIDALRDQLPDDVEEEALPKPPINVVSAASPTRWCANVLSSPSVRKRKSVLPRRSLRR